MFSPDPDYYEAHDDGEETYVAAQIYGKQAADLRGAGWFVVSEHAQWVPESATFQALLWETTTIWLTEEGTLIDYQSPPIPLEKSA